MSGGVLFVCLGNICRSPMAAAVARDAFHDAGLDWTVASAGIGDWHVGQGADPRACRIARTAGHPMDDHRARQIHVDDFDRFDWILAMDRSNLLALESMAPAQFRARVDLLLSVAGIESSTEVPDPYFGDEAGFEPVLALIRRAIDGLAAGLGRSRRHVSWFAQHCHGTARIGSLQLLHARQHHTSV